MGKKNQFNFDFEVIYAGGERAKVLLAGCRPRAVVIGRFAVLLHDVFGYSFEEMEHNCQQVLVNGRYGMVSPKLVLDKVFPDKQEFDAVLEKIGGESLKDEYYVFVEGDKPVLLNPETLEVGKYIPGQKLRARPVVYLGSIM